MKETLKQLRKEKGMTQQDVAGLLGITKSAFGYYEQGKTVPDANGLIKLARIFDTTTDHILGIEGEKQPYIKNATQGLKFIIEKFSGLDLEEKEINTMTKELLDYLHLLTLKYK